jgi:hypothetical protein
MRHVLSFVLLPALALGCRATPDSEPSIPNPRGTARADHGRPDRFPHRIWAFSGFEARPHMFGWFGAEETKNIPGYPGNTAARRGAGPWKNFAALKTGMNPVPGPRMGEVNKLYVRYFLRGADRATFQHYSLSSGDNCHIRVSGMKQGEWAEMVLHFTRDSRRNDGSPGAFKRGERMDDLQVYVGKPGQEKDLEIIIDDPIFFAENPDLPPEPEPFPRRVIFLAAFDTGIDSRSRPKFYPGRFEPAVGAGETFGIRRTAPKGGYWVVAAAVPAPEADVQHVRLEMKPPRPVGPNTRVRFRYWLRGVDKMDVCLHDATDSRDRRVSVTRCQQAQWATRYVTFSRGGTFAGGGPFPTGNRIDAVTFSVPNNKDVELYVDEIVVYDAPERSRP